MAEKQHINRRDFIKLGAAGAVSAFVFNKFSPVAAEIISSGKNVSYTSKEFRKGIPAICNLCPARCGILGFKEYDYLVGIQGNPLNPNNKGKICARGIAGMNLVYHPERILYPLKRNGKRGEGKWKKISWDEAMQEVASRFQAMKNNDRMKDIVIHTNQLNLNDIRLHLIRTSGSPTIICDHQYNDRNKSFAHKVTWGEEQAIVDVKNSRYILNFGANPFESLPGFINFSQRIVEACTNNGAKLITIDPRLSNTAARSHQWIPVKPGTDAIVMLAMANIIIQKELYDVNFISRWTNISIRELKDYLSPFTLTYAEQQSTIPADQIEKLALDFAMNKPSVAFSGSGITHHSNGVQNERCLMLLNAIAGNIDVKGGYCLPRRFRLDTDSDENYHGNLYDFIDQNNPQIDTLITYKSNPVFEYPGCHKMNDLIKDEKSIPYSIAITTVMSETAALADLVLPSTTYLEEWQLYSGPAYDLVPFVAMGQPVLQPQGMSKSFEQILFDLASTTHTLVNRNDKPENIEDHFKYRLLTISRFDSGKNYNQLKRNGIWQRDYTQPEYQLYMNNGFKTDSYRFEINSRTCESVYSTGLPEYIPIPEHIHLTKQQIILIPYSVNVMSENLAHAKWLSEIAHDNSCLINPVTARKLKLTNGAQITLVSAAGETHVKLRVTSTVHPGVIALSKGFGHWAYGNVAQAKKFTSDDPDTKLIWWAKLSHGANPNILITCNSDPAGKGFAWNDTIVSIKNT